MNDDSIRPMDVIRPYLVLACLAFVVGFVGYWVVGRPLAPTAAAQDRWEAPVSASGPDDWNVPKKI
jgi:hypothetical protein